MVMDRREKVKKSWRLLGRDERALRRIGKAVRSALVINLPGLFFAGSRKGR